MDDEFNADEMDELDADELDDEAFDDEFDAKRRRGSARVRVFRLMPKRHFDYSFLPSSGTTTQSITIRRALKVPSFYYYWMGLRIHNRDIAVGGGSFTVNVYQTLPSSQDPQEFTVAAASLVTTCVAGDAPPAVKTSTSSNLGPYLKVVLTAAQGSSGGARLYAELSAVLFARPA